MWTWGYNALGQLGDNTVANRNAPVQAIGLTNVVQVAGGQYHSLALKSDGTAYAWGYNGYGQLGDGTVIDHFTPTPVSGFHEITAIASGYFHSLAMYRIPIVYMSNLTLQYGQRRRLIARLYNTVLSTDIIGANVTFSIDGTVVGSATSASNGSGNAYAQINPYTLDDNLSVGTHTLTATYDGNNGVDLPNSITTTLTVQQTPSNLSGINASGPVGDLILLRARLSRTTDLGLLAGQFVAFFIDGNFVGATATDTGGIAALNYEIPAIGAGTHTLTMKYKGSSRYTPANSSATLTVAAADTNLAVNSATQTRGRVAVLSARLWNVRNYGYLAGQTVTFSIDGTVVGTGVTGSDGYARYSFTVPTSFSIGAHTIDAEFAGDTSYNASAGSGTLTVN